MTNEQLLSSVIAACKEIHSDFMVAPIADPQVVVDSDLIDVVAGFQVVGIPSDKIPTLYYSEALTAVREEHRVFIMPGSDFLLYIAIA